MTACGSLPAVILPAPQDGEPSTEVMVTHPDGTFTLQHGTWSAHVTWQPDTGAAVPVLASTAVPMDDISGYTCWLEYPVKDATIAALHTWRAARARWTEHGLAPRVLPASDLTDEQVIWCTPGTPDDLFGHPYLIYDVTSATSDDIEWECRLAGFARTPRARLASCAWNDSDGLARLAERALMGTDAVMVEAALTDPASVDAAVTEHRRTVALDRLAGTLTRAQHIPYTRIAKNLTAALNEDARRERRRTGRAHARAIATVFPLTVAGSRVVPAVIVRVKTVQQDATVVALTGDGWSILPGHEAQPRPNGCVDTVWVADPRVLQVDGVDDAWADSFIEMRSAWGRSRGLYRKA